MTDYTEKNTHVNRNIHNTDERFNSLFEQKEEMIEDEFLFPKRMVRFGASSSSVKEDLSHNDTTKSLRPYYNDDLVHERMTSIRYSINYIRLNWSEYDEFKDKLLKQLPDSELLKDLVEKYPSDWVINKSDISDISRKFHYLKMYTDADGYKQIFRLVRNIFRTDSSTDLLDVVTSAVFLVELINIDLYNYVLLNPAYNNYEGVVYRGMCVQEREMTLFMDLAKQPINKRYIAIPLALDSASSSYQISEKFVRTTLEDYPDSLPLIMKIYVVSMDEHYKMLYQRKFTNVVVSSLCAVPIHELSKFPHEREVLLRGAFYQFLNVYKGDKIADKEGTFIDLVMVTGNRDHKNNSFLGDDEAPARKMFGLMASISRGKFIVPYCYRNSLYDDGLEYEKQMQSNIDTLDELLH